MSASPRPERVRCPECGEFFSRRGLAGHRRFKHAEALRASKAEKTQEEIAVELERQRAALPGADAVKAQTHLLAQIADLLRGLDSRLERIEACALTSSFGESAEAPASESNEGSEETLAEPAENERDEAKRLSKDLQEVLRSIAALRSERQESANGPCSDEIDRQLGRLRMRQAGLLFRLGKDAPGAPPESEGGFDWF